MHPETAEARGIAAGDWVAIETPSGRARARAKLNASLDARVVCGQHGWWQACAELGAPGYDPFGPDSANFNLIIGGEARDPVSGTPSHRAHLCEVRRIRRIWRRLQALRAGASEPGTGAAGAGVAPGCRGPVALTP